MNELVEAEQSKQPAAVSESTKSLIKSGVSENTIRAYGRALANLSKWLDGRVEAFHIDDRGNGLYRPHDAALAEYITALHEAGKSPSTISQAVAAVKWRFGENSVGEITKKTLAGIRREGKNRGRGQVAGLTWQEVERVCSFAEASKTLAGLRDSAIINLMSDCLLRVSEAVAVNVEDIHDGVLEVRQSKTDQEGEGATLYIGELTHRVIKRYCRKAGIESGALFRRVRFQPHLGKGRLSAEGARNAIKRWASEAGVEGFISGHSLRVGSAVSLARAGATVVDMQTAGRWKSPAMPAHYARAELAEQGAIARFKYGK